MQENTDWWDSLTKEQIASIDKGLEDVKAGRLVSSKEVWEKYGRKPRG